MSGYRPREHHTSRLWRRRAWRLIVVSVVIAALGSALVGCRRREAALTPIGDITKEPQRYQGQTVRLRGTVGNLYKVPPVVQLYVLKDDTGEIYVEPLGPLPPLQAQLHVQGVVDSLLIIPGTTIGTRLKEVLRR